ncbi:MAG: hypothetical protein A4E53_03269 [Pelotomaculum sp. PtaB.Bin104]|nr:MAG: hypothetical protein A4E53_03269 [Pelotomaculum sp. PtaB.Bin104]
MSQDLMETTYEGYKFKAKPGYLYHQHECWVKEEDDGLRRDHRLPASNARFPG